MTAHDNLASRVSAPQRLTLSNLLADLRRVKTGVMNWRSLLLGYLAQERTLDIVVTRSDGTVVHQARENG
jgi:hypothetical protein